MSYKEIDVPCEGCGDMGAPNPDPDKDGDWCGACYGQRFFLRMLQRARVKLDPCEHTNRKEVCTACIAEARKILHTIVYLRDPKWEKTLVPKRESTTTL